jgi:hypothetical protein
VSIGHIELATAKKLWKKCLGCDDDFVLKFVMQASIAERWFCLNSTCDAFQPVDWFFTGVT